MHTTFGVGAMVPSLPSCAPAWRLQQWSDHLKLLKTVSHVYNLFRKES